jgi:DNA polymerase-3 subunit delta'
MPDLLDIVGQDEALARLQRAVAGRRRPHAYLLAGPEGVGRRTTAREFARLLLCEAPVTRPNAGRLGDLPDDFPLRLACGECGSCRTLSAGTNTGYHLIEKELTRYHDDQKVRDQKMQDLSVHVLRQFLIEPAHRSAAGRGRVFVVRQAELMNHVAQNALLKTLEEPPAGVTILLLTTSPGELLATTRSRCQLVRFGPLPRAFVAERLVEAGVAAGEADFWAALTGGSIGRSLRLAESGLYELKQEVVSALAAAAPVDKLSPLLVKAMEAQAKPLTTGKDAVAASLANRQAGGRILSLIAALYRDALTVRAGADRPLIHADQTAEVRRIADRFNLDRLADILDHLARCERLIWRNVGAKLLWDNVAVSCTTAAPMGV